MERNLCFIVMGFGKKKDPDTNRTIDLDATYKNNPSCRRIRWMQMHTR